MICPVRVILAIVGIRNVEWVADRLGWTALTSLTVPA